MTDDRRGSTTRRGLVGLAAGVALAGCSALPNPFDDPPPRLDGARLTEVTAGGVPTIPDTVPVAVADDHVTADVERVEGLLSRAPLPFDADELPNGAMREEMNGTAETARTELDRARDAASPLEALAVLRDARGNARTVATTWAYADDGLRRSDIAADADALGDDVAAFRDRHSTVGDDPVRAVLVHEVVESLARTAASGAAGRPENPRETRAAENLVTVSERAADLERGRAALETAASLYDGLRADLEQSRDLESVFEAVATDLSATVRDATAGFDRDAAPASYVDADIADTVVRYPLNSLHDDLAHRDGTREHLEEGDVASAVLDTYRDLTRLRAFQGLRDRVERGDVREVESVADVAAVRETAITAIETARAESARPRLARRVLGAMAGFLRYADREIGGTGGQGEIPVDVIRRNVGDYVYAAAVARATPAVSDTVATALAR